MKYAILYNPGHNRVYFETSIKLSVSEFNVAAQHLSTVCGDVQSEKIAGIDYLTFRTQDALTEKDVTVLSDLSFVYALFELGELDGAACLKPIRRGRENFVDESISTIMKYTGKTNEIFTRMMLNVAYYSQGSRENIKLLDPIAGKGTTLYEGLIRGYNVYGIEIGDKVVGESYHFMKRFLETERYKFQFDSIRMSGPNKSYTAARHTFVAAKTKEAFRAKDTRTIEFIAGNSIYADKFYKKNTFDMIVGDLPYGIQHGNVTGEKQSSLTRNPTELLRACLPVWSTVLKPGGVIVLAWNSNVLTRERMTRLFEGRDLTVLDDEVYLQFEHRVDQSILRDIVVARKNA